MGYLVSAEVIETSKAYGKNQKDEKGRTLPLGSVKIKLHPNSLIGNVRAHYARPLFTNFRNIPLRGEHVVVFELTGFDGTDAPNLDKVLYYIPLPINSTNDSVINQIPHASNRSKSSDNKPAPPFVTPGNTFPKRPYTANFMQPFEGDTTFTGRGGSSIRLGIGSGPHPQHENQPTWKSGKAGNPITIVANKPIGPNKPLPNEVKDIPNREIKDSLSYAIEDAANDFSTTYWTSDQALSRFVSVRACPSPLSSIPSFNKAQSATNADRIVIQAKKDNMMLIAKKTMYLSASKIRLTTDKHDVDFDDLVDFVLGLHSEVQALASLGGITTSPTGGPSLVSPRLPSIISLRPKYTINPSRGVWGGGCSQGFPQPPSLPSNFKLGTDGLSRVAPTGFTNSIPGMDGKTGGSITASPDMPGGTDSIANSIGNPSVDLPNFSINPNNALPKMKPPGTPEGASNSNTEPIPEVAGSSTEPDGSPANLPDTPQGEGTAIPPGTPGNPSGPGEPGGPSGPGTGNPDSAPGQPGGPGGPNGPGGPGSPGTPFNPETDLINIPVDFIYPDGKCYGHLFKIVSILKSKRTLAIVSDVVYLILVIKENCKPGWYIVGDKFKYNTDIEKLLSTNLFILEESMLVEKKILVNSDCIRKELEVTLYEDNYAHLSHELVDLNKIVEVNF